MIQRALLLITVILAYQPQGKGQQLALTNGLMQVDLDAGGCIRRFSYEGNKTAEFRADDRFRGPSMLLDGRRLPMAVSGPAGKETADFGGTTDSLACRIHYRLTGEALIAEVFVKNRKSFDIPVRSVSLNLGINTEMDSFPHWNRVFFPTMLRCETTHFWGYLMNPAGEIIVVSSPDPVASWHYAYKSNQHRIFTIGLDLMHELPLPVRHPQNLQVLKAGDEKSWSIRMIPCENLDRVKVIAAEHCQAPMIDAKLYTVSDGEDFNITLKGSVQSVEIIAPDGKGKGIQPMDNKLVYRPGGVGKYRLVVTGKNGKVSEATLSVRKPWSWYLHHARLNALEQEQKGGSHTESWYGFFSMFLAQKYFPDADLWKRSLDKFNEIYPLMYDEQGYPKSKILFGSWDIINRIQNTACMVSLLTDLYEVTLDTGYLAKASVMCDFLMKNQDSTGAYRNGKVHYTSVVYIAKSFLEISQAEVALAGSSTVWQARYLRHFESATRAIDELVLHGDDIQTEGEMTYEDGMIACSYAQISMYATLIPENRRQKYIDAAEYLRKGHRSLSQLLVPDSRMNGGSLRYWESQYDVLSFANLMSSPHGWSAWRVYGLWYLYQLTGNPDLIAQVYNALGSDVQLIDEKSGVLRWAFCVDPYIRGDLLVKDPAVTIRENRGIRKDTVIGEQYIGMISDWYKAKPDTWVTGYWEPDGGCCDNDVHEIFKCLGEVVLTNACVVIMPGGEIRAYNCRARFNGKVLRIDPDEKTIRNVNVNNLGDSDLEVSVNGRTGSIGHGRMQTMEI